MNDPQNQPPASRAAVTASLAVVGFVALVALGMWLAISASRYVPSTVSRIGAAAVALTSIFSPATPPSAGSASSTPSAATSTPPAASSTSAAPAAPRVPTTPGQETSSETQIGGSGAPVLAGLPDLDVSVTAVGYLTTNSTASFVASSNVPSGYRPAVQFTVKNIGTNIAGQWIFMASIPTTNSFVYTSLPQQALNPGDSIDYTLGFDSAAVGTGKTITITVNSDHRVTESNTNNDVATANVNVQ
jgi:hypothetical protein